MDETFFDELEEQSAVKAEIVVNYFAAWSRIMVRRAERIGYFDFFAGPGRYRTGEKSTPLLILERSVASNDLAQRLVTVFNDANPDFTSALQREVDELPGIETLRYRPQILTGELTDELVGHFESIRMIPALSFVDPWGYKGLSLRLLRAVIKDWGCEVVFFFNYNRINMGITNPKVEEHMEALFGSDGLVALRKEIAIATPAEREALIKRRLGEALQGMGAKYLIPFTFVRNGGRVSHYICFISKHPLGYSIMKEIMANRGVVDEDGVPVFEYVPAAGGRQLEFGKPRPLSSLPEDLIETFSGQSVTVLDVYERHNVGTPFIKRNYKAVLMQMEERGDVVCEPDQASRKVNTMADHVLVSFPPRQRRA